MSTQYSLHEIVWAKCTGHPWWPAKIVKITVYQNNITIYKVFFYASDEYSEVLEEHLAAYDSFFFANSVRMADPILNKAILYAERSLKKRAARKKQLNKAYGKSNPIIPDIKFVTFSKSGISVQKSSACGWNIANFKPLTTDDLEEYKKGDSATYKEERQKDNQEASNEKHNKLKQFCRKLYKLFKNNRCDRHQSRMFCLQLMKKIENSGFLKEEKLSFLIACIKRDFSMLEILNFEQMKTRIIDLFNKTMSVALDRPVAKAEA